MSGVLANYPLEPGYRYFEKTPEFDPSRDRKSPEPYIAEGGGVRDSVMGPWTRVGSRTTLSETVFGAYSYIVSDSSIAFARIGKFCSIARDARINPGNHPTWRAAQHHFSYRAISYDMGEEDDLDFFQWRRDDEVQMGHDIWLGHGVTVLAGVKIGTGAVVGAGAVVSKDVEPYTINVGVPAKPIKMRFPEQVQRGLLDLAWWDWSHEQLTEALHDFRELDAGAFVEKYS